MNPDGTVARATVSDPTTFNSEAERRAAESAMRAMLNPRCQPFPLPPGAYENWKTLKLTFDVREMTVKP